MIKLIFKVYQKRFIEYLIDSINNDITSISFASDKMLEDINFEKWEMNQLFETVKGLKHWLWVLEGRQKEAEK